MKASVKKYIRSYPHVLMFCYVPVYTVWFFTLEHLIVENYWVSWLPVDDIIPFLPGFILFYVLWFPDIILPAAFLYFRDTGAFKRYAWYVMLAFSLSMFICSVFPNGQNLRPVLPQQRDFCTALAGAIYAADTNTNVLPSMHVVGCIGVAFSVWDAADICPRLRRWRIPLLALQVLIIISTVFVKQHSVLDQLAGLAVGGAIGCFLWRKGSPLRRPTPPPPPLPPFLRRKKVKVPKLPG